MNIIETTRPNYEHIEPQEPRARFEDNACRTLDQVQETFAQRGRAYADTWQNCSFLYLKAIAREVLGIELDNDTCRVLASAAFIDMKYARMEGGYMEDHPIDGIAYMAYLVSEVRRLRGIK